MLRAGVLDSIKKKKTDLTRLRSCDLTHNHDTRISQLRNLFPCIRSNRKADTDEIFNTGLLSLCMFYVANKESDDC